MAKSLVRAVHFASRLRPPLRWRDVEVFRIEVGPCRNHGSAGIESCCCGAKILLRCKQTFEGRRKPALGVNGKRTLTLHNPTSLHHA